MKDLGNSVEHLMKVRSPAKAHRVIQERSELLDEAAVRYLLELGNEAQVMGDERARRGFEQRQ
jgi:hypothetical protein